MRLMKSYQSLVLVLAFVFSQIAFAEGKFPLGPVASQTPGELCQDSPVRRYPENIVYCERNVDTALKNQIIKMYDEKFGYSIRSMSRGDFKIDHFVPLSIGGSNGIDNLWPQHKSVYGITDDLEQVLFDKISLGKIKQDDAIRVIREGKIHLEKVPDLLNYVNGL